MLSEVEIGEGLGTQLYGPLRPGRFLLHVFHISQAAATTNKKLLKFGIFHGRNLE